METTTQIPDVETLSALYLSLQSGRALLYMGQEDLETHVSELEESETETEELEESETEQHDNALTLFKDAVNTLEEAIERADEVLDSIEGFVSDRGEAEAFNALCDRSREVINPKHSLLASLKRLDRKYRCFQQDLHFPVASEDSHIFTLISRLHYVLSNAGY